ncbi:MULTISPECIES: hypothetical protein [Mesorhizobium]|uniref:Cytochrome c domain-containing protein n=4 Tax=Mesorhizobium TaxID=68287 RepID=A0A1A5HRE6_RHILI|nr:MULTISPECIES: hypothetical protein [Mesorhizobium]MBE1709047.1 cytochrome C [Mesorhizobium japonicum]MBE1717141.1 cytochrome C [Mesorhizobium japonicum]MUT22484.1 cytochrome C [Mesorhizobium japonicum]MUT29762.1 cytochrome C [Mesorhizobium japonicum]OBP69212.1 hypothetical protein BAE42_21920 [Mesorhizobium loti]
MRTIDLCAAVALCIVPSSQLLAADEVSVERGLYISIIGGCHFCHTEGYREAEGKIDPDKALKGSSIGWQGPWGTNYAANLRDTAMGFNEDKWVDHLKNKVNLPPMPWYQVQAMSDSDLRSIYLYIKSLGPPGELAPFYREPGKEPRTPYVILEPPQTPKKK